MADEIIEEITKRLPGEEEPTIPGDRPRVVDRKGDRYMAEDLKRFAKPLPIGYNIYLKDEDTYYEIKSRTPFNIEVTYSELLPGEEITQTEERTVEPSEDTVYQVMFGVKNLVNFYWWQPSSTRALGTDKEPDGFVDPDVSPFNSPNDKYTLFLPPEESIHINIENKSTFATVEPVIRYTGWKYEVQEMSKKPDTFLTIPTETFGG